MTAVYIQGRYFGLIHAQGISSCLQDLAGGIKPNPHWWQDFVVKGCHRSLLHSPSHAGSPSCRPEVPHPGEESATVRRPVPAYSVRATSAVSSRNCFLRLVHTRVTVC